MELDHRSGGIAVRDPLDVEPLLLLARVSVSAGSGSSWIWGRRFSFEADFNRD